MLIVSCSVAFWGFCGLGEWTGCPSTSQRWTVASPQQPYFNPLVPSSTPNIPTTLAKLSSFALVVRKGWWVTASLTFWFPLFYHALSLFLFSAPSLFIFVFLSLELSLLSLFLPRPFVENRGTWMDCWRILLGAVLGFDAVCYVH